MGRLGFVLVPAFLSTVGLAAPIFVANSSFETLPVGGLPNGGCGANCLWSDASSGIPGWNVGSQSGLFQPGSAFGNTAYFNFVPDGITVAWVDQGSITQTTAATVQLGVTYSLLVEVGRRTDLLGVGSIHLVIGGSTLILGTGSTPAVGGWSTYTATYTGLAGDVGKSIGIALNAGTQGDYDNVRLNNNIPEPATWTLIGAGVLALAARKRR